MLDAGRLRKHQLESHPTRYFHLVTDEPRESVAPLLPLMDGLVDSLGEYFGPLPPAADGKPFRCVGYLMADRDAFAAAGVLPAGLPLTFHGRQVRNQFWLNRQQFDYYRRHLLLHEVVHVWMRHLPGAADNLPPWYLEGMAELLAVHVPAREGAAARFNVMPPGAAGFGGFERIEIIRRDMAAQGRLRTIDEVRAFSNDDFAQGGEAYAWSWALCRFLDSHPRYQSDFRWLSRHLVTHELTENFKARFDPRRGTMHADWAAFVTDLDYGYDFDRHELPRVEAKSLALVEGLEICSDRGWQATGLSVRAGETWSLTATGEVTLASQPRPWRSSADGISFRYVGGQPAGRLQAVVLVTDATASPQAVGAAFLKVVSPGRSGQFQTPAAGTLLLRVNDAAGERADNTGAFRVALRRERSRDADEP